MTLTALENQLIAFNKRVEEWEAAGLRGSAMMHECRTLAQMVMVFQSQVHRAVTILKGDKEDKVTAAIKELGDYIITL